MRSSLAELLAVLAILSAVEPNNNRLQVSQHSVLRWQDKTPSRESPINLRSHHGPSMNIHADQFIPSCKRKSNYPRQRQEQTRTPETVLINASAKSSESANPLNNIKLTPRKKELWLPWPLGELRNDYHRFAEQQMERQTNHQLYSSHQQQRIKEYYRDDASSSLLHRSRDWAGKVLQRGQSLAKGLRKEDVQPLNYWVKQTTTPMATASASMKENRHNNNGNKQKKKIARGGDDFNAMKEESKWDNEMILKYIKLQMKVRLRQLGYVGSDFSIHLPPASPALLLLYALPSAQDPMRRLVKFSLTGATISWIHSEATKYRRFAPLPIMHGMNVRRPDLLPFLPEELREKDEVILEDKPVVSNTNTTHALWDPFQSFGTISSAYRSWLEGQSIRDKRSHEQRRVVAQSKLLEMMESRNSSDTSENSYALITGASRGIGRALAIELARYRIPLILVARDITKLTAIAQDIEKYYNVPCRILQADLSSPDCASRIHAATTEAGLKVDILINNAGVCSHGEMTRVDRDSTNDMIQVNLVSVVKLSQLYGKDMKERRRGRILFVSSMAGAMPGCASVGIYAATKAFEKSLASSLGREMERYGVGVTCLLPGAVKDTEFASRSDVETAVCFQVPGYAKTPEMVAGEGVKAMMLGYPEVYPGWENKVFAKIVMTHLPARVAGLIGEFAWSTSPLGALSKNFVESPGQSLKDSPATFSHNTWKFKRLSGNIIKLPELPKLQMPKARQEGALLSDNLRDTAIFNATNLNTVSPTGERHKEGAQMSNSTNATFTTRAEIPIPPAPTGNEGSPPSVDGMVCENFDSLLVPDINETWYPSMIDQKPYDFRDRRLDY